MLESLTRKQKIIFFIILSFMIIFILIYFYFTFYKSDTSNNLNVISTNDLTIFPDVTENNITDTQDTNIIIYICGAVKESKVISLPENSRISNAIDAVGGLEEKADLTNINLAYILSDGEKIYIPFIGEENTQATSIFNTLNSTTSTSNSKININKASQTELEQIPGIGPSTALKIINYRTENGKFKSIEDIKNISGIGDSKFNNIKNYICVK